MEEDAKQKARRERLDAVRAKRRAAELKDLGKPD
jgi:hypothetical protein